MVSILQHLASLLSLIDYLGMASFARLVPHNDNLSHQTHFTSLTPKTRIRKQGSSSIIACRWHSCLIFFIFFIFIFNYISILLSCSAQVGIFRIQAYAIALVYVFNLLFSHESLPISSVLESETPFLLLIQKLHQNIQSLTELLNRFVINNLNLSWLSLLLLLLKFFL